jgi:hypothetical protein
VSSETSFVSKQPKLEPKLVSALSETRRLFRLFRFNIENREFRCFETTETNKRPTETAANLLKYQPFYFPYHKFCLFWLFRYRFETLKQTKKKKLVVSQKSKPKNNRNRLSFGLFWFKPRKKICGFEDPIRERFLEIFSVCFKKILFVSVVSVSKQTQKKVFWFRETNRKTTETD